MDLTRAPRRAPLTARKKGSGYENEAEHDIKNYSKVRPDTQVIIIQTEVNVIC